jgi:hypothetical protein
MRAKKSGLGFERRARGEWPTRGLRWRSGKECGAVVNDCETLTEESLSIHLCLEKTRKHHIRNSASVHLPVLPVLAAALAVVAKSAVNKDRAEIQRVEVAKWDLPAEKTPTEALEPVSSVVGMADPAPPAAGQKARSRLGLHELQMTRLWRSNSKEMLLQVAHSENVEPPEGDHSSSSDENARGGVQRRAECVPGMQGEGKRHPYDVAELNGRTKPHRNEISQASTGKTGGGGERRGNES